MIIKFLDLKLLEKISIILKYIPTFSYQEGGSFRERVRKPEELGKRFLGKRKKKKRKASFLKSWQALQDYMMEVLQTTGQGWDLW